MTLLDLRISMGEPNLMINDMIFKTNEDSALLIFIGILAWKNDKVLLGKRGNKPSQEYYFSSGVRVNKNETIKSAIVCKAKSEIDVELTKTPKFIGVFDHLYDDSMYENISTHYINLAYEYEVKGIPNLPMEHHSGYQWFGVEELLNSDQAYLYSQGYFRN